MTGRGRGTEPETVFEADPRLRDHARLTGYAIAPAGVLVGALFIVLGLTGVIPYDPLSDWWWTLLILAGAVVMAIVIPRSFTQTAELKLRQPFVEIHPDAISYVGSRIPDFAIRAVLRADLPSHNGENSRWQRGDTFYVLVRREQLGFTRDDGIMRTKRGQIDIAIDEALDPVRMSRAVIAHLEATGTPFVDCGTDLGQLVDAAKRYGRS